MSSKNSKSSLNGSPASSRDGSRTEMDGRESSILLIIMICYAHIYYIIELNFNTSLLANRRKRETVRPSKRNY